MRAISSCATLGNVSFNPLVAAACARTSASTSLAPVTMPLALSPSLYSELSLTGGFLAPLYRVLPSCFCPRHLILFPLPVAAFSISNRRTHTPPSPPSFIASSNASTSPSPSRVCIFASSARAFANSRRHTCCRP